MKATGIVRRIDDLGRVVVPKEIRRNLGIREGDPLEIFLDEQGGITFKPYKVDEGQILSAAIEQLYNMGQYERSEALKKLLKENGFEIKSKF